MAFTPEDHPTTAFIHIPDVVGVRSQNQVRRIDASAIVAAVANHLPGFNDVAIV